MLPVWFPSWRSEIGVFRGCQPRTQTSIETVCRTQSLEEYSGGTQRLALPGAAKRFVAVPALNNPSNRAILAV
jgi:hypothetical protein